MITLAAAGPMTALDVTWLLIAFAVLLGVARLFGEVARYFKQPAVLGEILAGVILGPTLLGWFDFQSWYEGYKMFTFLGDMVPMPEGKGETAIFTILEGAVTIAAVLLLLIAGLEVDLGSVRRQGKATAIVSIAGMALPFATGFLLGWLLPNQLGMEDPALKLPFALFIGVALSITALPVIAKILMDLNLSKSDTGMLIVSSAMINDLIGWVGFALILAMIAGGGDASQKAAQSGSGATGVLMTIGLTLLFIGLMLTIGRWLANHTLPWIQAHLSWPGGPLVFIMVVAVLCAAFTEAIGIHSIFGAFIAGVAIGDSRHLKIHTRETIHQFISNIFAPLFFVSIGLRVDFLNAFDWFMVVVVMVVACVGKIIGCWAGARYAGIDNRQSWAIGFGMVARGAMEIILAQLALDAGLIDDRLFVAIVIMAIVTSMIAGPLMQMVLKQKEQRRLSSFLSEKQFVPDMRASTVRDAIAELCEVAAAVTKQSAQELAQLVWQREQMMSTGLERGIAVPHARVEGLDRPVVVIGRCERGIDFNAADGERARIICLLLTPTSQPTSQLELLNAVAFAFKSPQVLGDAMDANRFTEFLAAINLGDNQSRAESH